MQFLSEKCEIEELCSPFFTLLTGAAAAPSGTEAGLPSLLESSAGRSTQSVVPRLAPGCTEIGLPLLLKS